MIKRGLRLIYGEGNDNPLQYSCLENPMDGGAWWATVHGVANTSLVAQMVKRLSTMRETQATVHGVAKSRTRLSDFIYSLRTHLGHSVPSGTDKEQKENNLNLVVREKNLTFIYSDQTNTDKDLLQLTGLKRSITLSVVVCTRIQRKKRLYSLPTPPLSSKNLSLPCAV